MRESAETRPSRRVAASRGRRGLAVAAIAGAVCLLATACQSAGSAGAAGKHAGAAPSTTAPPQPTLAISPSDGSSGVKPDAAVTVAPTRASVQKVTVTEGGKPVQGATTTLADGSTAWHSAWPLQTSSTYTVTATGTGKKGQSVTSTSTFHTLKPSQTFQVQIFEGYQQTYGVGMPIILKFSQPVKDKAAMERALELTTSHPVVGAWRWDSSKEVDFRPRTYWPANTQVSFTGHFDGAQIAPGVYGTANLTQSFKIGTSLIVVASTKTHYMKIYRAGKLYATWPISTGDAANPTADGTYLTIEKHNPVRMIGPGYNTLVPYSVRFTWSGNYIHDAYWSVAQQGHVNVSHGCVNVSPQHSKIYFDMAVPGDPVTITGSPAAGKWDDGWTEWFLTWPKYLQGSALHMAVKAGPSGSSFVSPSDLSAPSAAAPLGQPEQGNYLAQ